MHFLTLFDFRSSPGLSEEENGVCSVQCPCNTELIQGVQLAKARVVSGGPSHHPPPPLALFHQKRFN